MARTAGGGGGHKVYRWMPLRHRVPDGRMYPKDSPCYLAEKMRTESTMGASPSQPLDSRLPVREDREDTTTVAERLAARTEEIFKRYELSVPPNNTSTGLPRGVARSKRRQTSRRKQRFEARFNMHRAKKNVYLGTFDSVGEASLAHEVVRKILTDTGFDHLDIEGLNALCNYAKEQALDAAKKMSAETRSFQDMPWASTESTFIGGGETATGSVGSATIASTLPTDDELDEQEEMETVVGDANDFLTEKAPMDQSRSPPKKHEDNNSSGNHNNTVSDDDSVDDANSNYITQAKPNAFQVNRSDEASQHSLMIPETNNQASATTPSVPLLQHPNLCADQLLKAHANGVADANDCWESTFISAFKLLPTDIIMPCIDNAYWAGNARMLRLISTRQSEYDAAVAAGSDLAQDLIVQQIFMSLRLDSLSTRFLVIVPNVILKIAGCPFDRVYWAVAGDNIAINEIRLELKRANAKQQDEKQRIQEEASLRHEIAEDDGKSYGLAQAILDIMEGGIAGGDNSEKEQGIRPSGPIIREEVSPKKALNNCVQPGDELKDTAIVCTDSKNNGFEKGAHLCKGDLGRRRAFRKCLTTIETTLYQEMANEEDIRRKSTSPSKSEHRAESGQKRKRDGGLPATTFAQAKMIEKTQLQKRKASIEDNSISSDSSSPHRFGSIEASESLKICVEMTYDAEPYGASEEEKRASLPEHSLLVNFPGNLIQPSRKGPQCTRTNQDTRSCVMCGKVCSFGPAKNFPANAQVIPNQNRGMCNKCDVKIWKMVELDIDIKFCKGCKNFRPWALFGEKRDSTKCKRCRKKAAKSKKGK